TADKYTYSDGVIVVDDPDAVKVTRYYYPYTDVELVAGENTVSFKNNGEDNRFNVTARDGYEVLRLYDAAFDEETTVSTWSSSTAISLKENSKFEITTGKVIRDMNVVFYADDLTNLWYGLQFSRGGFSINATEGYTLVDYREKDGKITVSATGATTDSKLYRNYEEIVQSYYSYYTIENIVDNEVIKLFFVPENAIEHTVTFDMVDGTLDGYEVKKDILAVVDPTEPVSAVGKTQFTIAPVAREGAALTVIVGDSVIEAVDGVYTFETEGDTTVKVSNGTTGIESVISGENTTADVYNLQGIRVARQANADEVNALPAGIYVVNGQKVIVK
ncbi:MAG: hypothetical protein K2M54_09640, partial [Muribaculaceae bacterium]|nr:hypothetical protein [Muribaculaceae bacterium]